MAKQLRHGRFGRLLGASALLLTLAACRQDMHDQPKYQPFEYSPFFDDHRASRPIPPGTVARGHLEADTALYKGMVGSALVEEFPSPVTREVMERGHERFDIYCSPCHDRVGSGHGMIVQRGFKQPPALTDQRLRDIPVGYLFQTVSNGFGTMPGYAAQIPARDRWAIVAYVRALQLSQHAVIDDVPPEERADLEKQQ
jgi:mono/diheme cytochrome c family protein